MSIEGAFLIWFVITFVVVGIFVVVTANMRSDIEDLEKNIDYLETQNARIKDRLLELESKHELLAFMALNKKSGKSPKQHSKCTKGGDAKCDL